MLTVFAIGSILAIFSTLSLILILIWMIYMNLWSTGDVFKILTILFISGIIYFSMTIITWITFDFSITPFIKIFSETSMFMWILNLIFSSFQYICYNQIMSKKNWIIFFMIGLIIPITLAIIGYFVLDLADKEIDDEELFVFEKSTPAWIYFLSTGILHLILYLIGFTFFIMARLNIRQILSKTQIEVKRRYFLVFRFILIHFFIYMLSTFTKILSFVISDLRFINDFSFFLSNSIGIFYLCVFIFTYFFNQNMIITNELENILNDTGETHSNL